jgi:hypothetical protein
LLLIRLIRRGYVRHLPHGPHRPRTDTIKEASTACQSYNYYSSITKLYTAGNLAVTGFEPCFAGRSQGVCIYFYDSIIENIYLTLGDLGGIVSTVAAVRHSPGAEKAPIDSFSGRGDIENKAFIGIFSGFRMNRRFPDVD